eukprot:CFRG0255T1
MPRLKLYNRYWLVASDDFVGVGVTVFLYRMLWATCTLGSIFYLWNRGCHSESHLYAYLVGSFAICIILAIVGVAVTRVSAMGCIMESTRRAPLNSLLYFMTGMFVFEALWTAYGCWMLWGRCFRLCHTPKGDLTPGFLAAGTIAVACVSLGLVILTVVCWYDRTSSVVLSDGGEFFHANRQKTISKIVQSLLCCTRMGKSREGSIDPYDEVSALLISLISEEIADVAPSDIVAALILLKGEHSRLYGVEDIPGNDRVDLRDSNSCHAILRAGYFVKYAVASYGWPVYLYMHLFSGLLKLMGCCRHRNTKTVDSILSARLLEHENMSNDMSGLNRSSSGGRGLHSSGGATRGAVDRSADMNYGMYNRVRRKRSIESRVVNDNCCSCNFIAMKLKTGIQDDEDVVYFNYLNNFAETPYYVVRDHNRKSIVISIRGSMSLNDALTDLHATPVMFDEFSHGDWCHQGILFAARYVYQELTDGLILEDAFEDFEHYDLVVVGHSLGAATASLLSIMLHEQYGSKLSCYAYSPPSGLMSASLASRCESYCMSVVVGRDIVPRLSIPNIVRFRDEMVTVIDQSLQPKYAIIGSGIRSVLAGAFRNSERNSRPEDTDLEAGLTVASEHSSFLGSNNATEQDVVASSSPTTVRTPTPPYNEEDVKSVSCLPGKVLHLVLNDSTHALPHVKREYVPCWRDKQYFNRILISPLIIAEHLPDRVQTVLESVCENIESVKRGPSG